MRGGNPSTVSRDAYDVGDSEMRVAEKTLNVLVMLLLKVAALVVSPGGRYRGQVHERVDALRAIVDCGQSLNVCP